MSMHLAKEPRQPFTPPGPRSVGEIAEALAGAGLTAVRLDDLVAAAIRNALVQYNGNRSHAAKALGISIRTIQRKLKVHGARIGFSSSTTAS